MVQVPIKAHTHSTRVKYFPIVLEKPVILAIVGYSPKHHITIS
jgi:hypothetical protein